MNVGYNAFPINELRATIPSPINGSWLGCMSFVSACVVIIVCDIELHDIGVTTIFGNGLLDVILGTHGNGWLETTVGTVPTVEPQHSASFVWVPIVQYNRHSFICALMNNIKLHWSLSKYVNVAEYDVDAITVYVNEN